MHAEQGQLDEWCKYLFSEESFELGLVEETISVTVCNAEQMTGINRSFHPYMVLSQVIKINDINLILRLYGTDLSMCNTVSHKDPFFSHTSL